MNIRTLGRSTRRKVALSIAAVVLAGAPAMVSSFGAFDSSTDHLTTSVIAP